MEISVLKAIVARWTLRQIASDLLGLTPSPMSISRAFRLRERVLLKAGAPVRSDRRYDREVIAYYAQMALRRLGVLEDSSEPIAVQWEAMRSDAPVPSFVETVAHFQSMIGAPAEPTPTPTREPSSRQKILVLSDLHIPFHAEWALERALSDQSDADVVVLLGDVLDMYANSRFGKERLVDPIVEIQTAAALIDVLAKRFPRVVVLEGNHDTRGVRWIRQNRPEMVLFTLHPFEYLRYVWQDGQLLQRYSNVEFARTVIDHGGSGGPVECRNLYLIGDAVLGHFERSLKGPARTSYSLALEWLPQWAPILFPGREIRVLVQAHVHRLSKVQWGPYTLFECGSMCDVMPYAISDPRYPVPQVGYVVLIQNDGRTEINESSYYVFQR